MKNFKVFGASLLALTITFSTVAHANEETAKPNIPDGGFASCEEAKEQGYTNMKEGTPGYSKHLDKPFNGVACEDNSVDKHENNSTVSKEKTLYLSEDPERKNIYYKGIKTTETAYVRNSKTYNISSQLKREKTMELTQEEIAALEALNQPDVPEENLLNPESGYNPEEGYMDEGLGQEFQGSPTEERDQHREERQNRDRGNEGNVLNEEPQEGFSADYEYGSPE